MKQGWTYRQLKDVTNKISDGSHNPPKGIAYSEYPMLSSKNILFDDFNYESPRYLSKEDFDIENKRTDISDGDVLLTIVGTVGRTCCVQNPFVPFTLQRSVAVLKPKKEILISRFLMYALYSLSDLWENEAKGAAQKGVYLKQLAAVSIPTPPISEQERIVERLDAAFAQIDELKSNAERQLAEARALFQAALTQAMQPKPGWQEKTVGELFDTYSGGTPIKSEKSYYENGNIPWIRSGEVCKQYITESEMFITEAGLKNSSAKFYPANTVLIAMYGATAAQVGILKFEATSNQAVCGILPHKNFEPEFVYYWFKSIQTFLASQAQGGAQPNISQQKIKRVKIPTISLEEQHTIVTHLDSLSNHVKELEEISRKTAADCDALKQALLRQIFE